jgi:hypothetical protein
MTNQIIPKIPISDKQQIPVMAAIASGEVLTHLGKVWKMLGRL